MRPLAGRRHAARGASAAALVRPVSNDRSRSRHVTCPVATYTACCSARWGATTTEGPNVNLKTTRLVGLMILVAAASCGAPKTADPPPPAPAVAGTGGKSGTGGSKGTG